MGALPNLPALFRTTHYNPYALRIWEEKPLRLRFPIPCTQGVGVKLLPKCTSPCSLARLHCTALHRSDGLHWHLDGVGHARQCLLSRGLLPLLAAPGPSSEEVLEEAVATAAALGLVGPHQHVVCVERIHDAFCVKVQYRHSWHACMQGPPACTAQDRPRVCHHHHVCASWAHSK